MRPFILEHADTPQAALQLAAVGQVDHPPQFLAGGTNVLDLMKCGVMRPDALVDINRLRADFGSITHDVDGLRLGALVRMSEAAKHAAVLRDYPMLSGALLQAASAQLRNM